MSLLLYLDVLVSLFIKSKEVRLYGKEKRKRKRDEGGGVYNLRIRLKSPP